MIRALRGAVSLALGAIALAACGGPGTQTAGIDRGGVTTPATCVRDGSILASCSATVTTSMIVPTPSRMDRSIACPTNKVTS